jgi:hypothetical protein
MVVVAIRISLALKLFYYSREIPPAGKIPQTEILYPILMRIASGKSQLFRFGDNTYSPGIKSSPPLANRAIIMTLGRSSDWIEGHVPSPESGTPRYGWVDSVEVAYDAN